VITLDPYTSESLNALAAIGETILASNGESWARNRTGKASFECSNPQPDGAICGVCSRCEAFLKISRAVSFIRLSEWETWLLMSPKEADAAFDDAPEIPMTETEIAAIVENVTSRIKEPDQQCERCSAFFTSPTERDQSPIYCPGCEDYLEWQQEEDGEGERNEQD
jgi:hypothetical protein